MLFLAYLKIIESKEAFQLPIKKVKKFFLYVYNKSEEKRLLRDIIVNNKEYLESGTYKIEFAGKIKIYLKDKNTKEFMRKADTRFLNSFSAILKYTIDYILFKFLTFKVVNTKNQAIRGSLIMVTYSRNIKIFDFSKKVILNKFLNDYSTYNNIKDAYHCMNEHLKMTILDFIDPENVYFEEYIDFIPYTQWTKQNKEGCMDNIFFSYQKYFLSTNSHEIKTQIPLDLFQGLKNTAYGNHKIFTEMADVFERNLNDFDFPFVRLHGDLKFDNVLLHKNEFYFIDLEFSSDYIFFYDIINYLFVTAIYEDHFYLESYLTGTYDELFKKLFNVFNIKYEEDQKLFYIAVYLIERIHHDYERIQENRLIFEDMLEKYWALFKNIKLS